MYDYKKLTDDLKNLHSKNIEIFSIGKSTMGKDIRCIKIGNGPRELVLNGAHHGLEYITSAFLMKFSDEYIKSADENKAFFDIYPNGLLDKITIYIIPMVNPDGVDIAQHGLDITNEYHRRLISNVGIHSFNEVWQANVNGVDINHNYNAGWRVCASRPSPTKYAGEAPEDQTETKAMADFLRKTNPDMLICFHSQGREIYYDYDGKTGHGGMDIANKMGIASGYEPCKPVASASYGGCKDWFIEEFGKCGFTIEIGSGKNPLPESELNNIYVENANIVLVAIDELLTLQD